MKRRVLGKGIEAIIANKPALNKNGNFIDVAIENIYPNPYQPRKNFSIEKIKELAQSIKENGMIQPVVLYMDKGKHYLLVGERRWRAAQYLKWEKVPAIIKDISTAEVMIAALVENVQREDLNAIELAEGIDLVINMNRLSQEDAADRLGMSRSTVTNYLRLLKLPLAVKKSIISDEISQGHARALLSLDDEKNIMNALTVIIHKKLSVRETEKLVKKMTSAIDKTKNSGEDNRGDPDLIKAEEKLSKLFSTKVSLSYKKNGNGKVTIFFNNLEEYERIINFITKE